METRGPLRLAAVWRFTVGSASYSANLLNQYTSRTVPSFVNILGQARTNATVTLWSADSLSTITPTYRKGEYFRGELAFSNQPSAIYATITNLAVLNNGTNADILSSNVGSIFLPQTPEVYAYDADGNLTRDGHWALTWNGENRLVALETIPAAVSTGVPKEKLEFTYDHQGRRVRKQVYAWDTDHWSLTSDIRFLYDGWNLLAILDPQSSILRSFTWGLDLSGSEQGAGGVGGLLLTTDHGLLTTGFACFDGNGNVMALVNAADGTESARYEYGPFGELIRATGPMAKANPFRFSTKYQDEETGWNYYGYRFLDSSVGRWLSRDPIGEAGGYNLFASADNDVLNATDLSGLWKWKTGKRDGQPRATVVATENYDTYEDLALFVHLDPDEVQTWLETWKPNHRVRCGDEFTVPNTVYVNRNTWWPVEWIGYAVAEVNALSADGFFVLFTKYVKRAALISQLEGVDTFGVVNIAHGDPKEKGYMQHGEGVLAGIRPMDVHPHHKLGLLKLVQCYGGELDWTPFVALYGRKWIRTGYVWPWQYPTAGFTSD